MFANTDAFAMFPEKLLSNGDAILCHDPNQPIHVFGVIPHQF